MKQICLYLHVHQPHRIKNTSVFDIGNFSNYFYDNEDTCKNSLNFNKIKHKSYFPTNNLLLKLLKDIKNFKVNLSITGVFIEQCLKYDREVLASFQKLVNTKKCEILAETYHHSLASLYSKKEFVKQVKKHNSMVKKYFNAKSSYFRNTELIYSDKIAQMVEDMGYSGIIAEGTEKILLHKSSNYLYQTNTAKGINLLLKNYKLSDDVAWRFSNKGWVEYPLNAQKYVRWLEESDGEIINIFLDYETFGEHQWADTKIFDFLKQFVLLATFRGHKFISMSDIKTTPKEKIKCPFVISWADEERDTSAWTGNSMQQACLQKLYNIEKQVLKTKNKGIINDWRHLQTSDHFYYMCTKYDNDGDAHKYFSPYKDPYEAFNNFNNCLFDLNQKINFN
ncbi:glycoside hydrolase family 57 protein [Patescibacteria group bacterium]|nr:glycoside hydrolase family 57 protein [Patescibacteria group bacterium]